MLPCLPAPQKPVVSRRREKQYRREAGTHERPEEDGLFERAHFSEARRERHREQEGEQHGDAGQDDPQALEELVELAVEAVRGVLVGHAYPSFALRNSRVRTQAWRAASGSWTSLRVSLKKAWPVSG